MAKLAPGDLAQVLSKLPHQNSENVIVGFDTADDAGVFRLSDDVALVQTLGFYTRRRRSVRIRTGLGSELAQ